MTSTPSTRSKGSKTPKRSRHSPPEAPTPKPLQKLSKQNKNDKLILNFLKTPTTNRNETRAGCGSTGRGRRSTTKNGARSLKGPKKKTIGQRRKSLSPPKTGRKLIKPFNYQSRAKSAPRTLLTFNTSSEEDDHSYDNRNSGRRNNSGNSELSEIRKRLA